MTSPVTSQPPFVQGTPQAPSVTMNEPAESNALKNAFMTVIQDLKNEGTANQVSPQTLAENVAVLMQLAQTEDPTLATALEGSPLAGCANNPTNAQTLLEHLAKETKSGGGEKAAELFAILEQQLEQAGLNNGSSPGQASSG